MAIARRGTVQTAGSTTTVAGPISVVAPAAIANNDVWIVQFFTGGNTTNVVAAPAGKNWVSAASQPLTSTGRSYLFWKVWVTGDTTTDSFTFTVSSSYGVISGAYSGCNTTTPVGAQSNAADNTSNTTLNVSAITTTAANSMAVLCPGIDSASTTYTVVPTGYSNYGENATGKRVRFDDQAVAGSGTSVPTGANVNYTTSASVRGAVFHIELLVASSGTIYQKTGVAVLT